MLFYEQHDVFLYAILMQADVILKKGWGKKYLFFGGKEKMKKVLLRKTVVFTVLFLFMMIVFTACRKNDQAEKSTADTVTKEKTEEKNHAAKIKKASINAKNKKYGDLRIISSGGSDAYTGNEQGMYYIHEYENGGSIEFPCIKFIDYKAGKEVYLCNKSNCLHKDYDCTAVLPDDCRIRDESMIFQDNNFLYLFMEMSYSDGGMNVSDANADFEPETKQVLPPILYRMKKDGTDRKAVYTFPSGFYVNTEIAFKDEKYLYFFILKSKTLSDGNITYSSAYDKQLVRIDLKKQNIEKILELNAYQNIIGCNGRSLLISERIYEKNISEDYKYKHEKEYEKLYSNSLEIYRTYDVDTGKWNDIKTIKNDREYNACISNGFLYYTDDNKKEVEKINLNTGEVKRIQTNDYLVLETTIQIPGEETRILGRSNDNQKRIFFHTKTNEITESTLKDKANNELWIISQNKEELFVISEMKKDKEGNILENTFSIISKKDFLNNRPDYRKVDVKFKGESELNYIWLNDSL